MEIGDAAYECQWYDLSPADRKLLIMIINRAKKPFDLTAGKFAVFSLELYGKVLAKYKFFFFQFTIFFHLNPQKNLLPYIRDIFLNIV